MLKTNLHKPCISSPVSQLFQQTIPMEPEIKILREVVDEKGGKTSCYTVNGEYREHNHITANAEFWEKIFNMKVFEDDTFVITYARVGTTLMQTILLSLLSKDFASDQLFKSSPFIEYKSETYDGIEAAQDSQRPRLLKTHLIKTLMPSEYFERKPKSVIVVRNFYDCMVSNYNFYLNNPTLKRLYKDLTFDQFYELFVDKEIHSCGSWFKWHKLWLEYATTIGEDHCLIVNYKDLVEDKVATVEKIAQFLGISASQESLVKVEEDSDFKTMQDRFKDFGVKNFIREGQNNKGRELFSENQLALFKEKVDKELGERVTLIKM